MHEVSLVHALFDQVDRALVGHADAALLQLSVRIGAMAGVEHELFRTAFEWTKEERGYPRARLDILVEDVAYACAECGAALATCAPFRCSSCDGRARLTHGDSLILERMELEVRDV